MKTHSIQELVYIKSIHNYVDPKSNNYFNNSFSYDLGSSITVAPSSSINVQPEVGVYPKGDDPNILLGMQIQAGTPLPQGPHGPVIPKLRPTSFPVTQTPNAPQVMQTVEPMSGVNYTPVSRKVSGGPIQGSHQIPGN